MHFVVKRSIRSGVAESPAIIDENTDNANIFTHIFFPNNKEHELTMKYEQNRSPVERSVWQLYYFDSI